MNNWHIFLIILGALILIFILYSHHKAKLIAAKPTNNGLGVQLRHAAENIPVYGSFVKAAGVVGKPLNNALNRFTEVQSNALKHIPVVGSTLAKPLDYSETVAKKVNNWLGL